MLCPGGHYDRSPCGTGTSAAVACLAADGMLSEGELWVQQSIIGSRFEARYRMGDRSGVSGATESDEIRVTISGRAHVVARTACVFDPEDCHRFGIKLETELKSKHSRSSLSDGAGDQLSGISLSNAKVCG